MKVEVRVKSRFSSRVQRARLERIVRRTLRAEPAGAGRSTALAIYVTDDGEMRSLNRRFHKVNASTDVLSFPAAAADSLGDIVVSYERARIQARAAGWRIADELDLLVVHGTLHLLGYDDLNARGRNKMWKRQKEILGREIR